MHRKSPRTVRNSSPEKSKSEVQRRSRRQSSRRRKRSSSRSSLDSEEVQPDAKKSVQDSSIITSNELDESEAKNKASDKEQTEIKSGNNSPERKETCGVESSFSPNKDSSERNAETEDVEEKKNKGKSKGKNKSNIEQTSNNIEPETENVQGTLQSPSNDYADNENVVQNIHDTTKLQEDSKVCDSPTSNQDQQQVVEESFVSAYNVFEPDNSDNTELVDTNSSSNIIMPDAEIKSTTPELKDNEWNTDKDSKANKSSGPESENSRTKKKIMLRRSPLGIKSTDEKMDENKPSKKITLKRLTSEDSNIYDVQSDEAIENRRLSFVDDDKQHDGAEKPKKVVKRVKLIRNVSRNVDENDEEQTRRTTLRRQKWGRSDWLNKLTSSFYKVDVESIKIVCPSLEFLSESEVNLEQVPRERKRSETDYKRKLSVDNKSEDSDRPDFEKQMSEDSSGEAKTESNHNIIALNRKISIVDDSASKLRPPPSPARNPTSNVLFITNLVRPFTAKQLKELLERTGKIKEEGFWTDRIKSKCYVQYESIEEAEATRNALHGVHWPIGNGKKLSIDYSTVEDLEKAKNPVPTPVILQEKLPEKENREPDMEDTKIKLDRDKERRKRDAPVREWDLGKEEAHRRFSRSRSRDRPRRHSRRSYTPEDYANVKKQRKADDAVPQKLMDDLFLKTKATPSVYWQPLSPEEIATKQQQRLVRMEEHKRRIEETRGRVRDGRRVPFRRR